MILVCPQAFFLQAFGRFQLTSLSGVFFTIPSALILPRFFGKFRLPLWASMILFVIIGWILVNFATWLYFHYLQELAQSLPEGPEKKRRDSGKVGNRRSKPDRCSLWWVGTCPLILSFLSSHWVYCKEAKSLQSSESLVLDSLFMEATEPFNYSLPVLAVWYLLPPILLLLRFYKKSPLPTWASCVLFCLIG